MSPDVLEVRVPVATVWTRPDAPRDLDRDALLDAPDVARWTAAMDADVRKGLDGRTLTQLLMGEAVEVVDERDGWLRVVAPLQPSSKDRRGYPGWVRRSHLGPPVMRRAGATASVRVRSTICDIDEGPRVELSFGTALRLDPLHRPTEDTDRPTQDTDRPTEDTARVLLPGGRGGTVLRSDVRLSAEQPRPGAGDILESARLFLGVRYLWGGTSSWGLDCSGLVHLAHRAHGVVVPRDASDQAGGVDPVPLDEVEPGDLYFFARPDERVHHVGFATRRLAADGTRWMLQAPEGGELVEDGPMAPHRARTLVSAGRVPRQ